MNRREFCSWVGVGLVASSLPVALAACSSDKDTSDKGTPSPGASGQAKPTTATSPAKSADGFQSVGTVAELDKAGRISKDKFGAGPLVVVRDPANSKGVVAVDPTCTHKGCLVNWQADSKAFVCPCHSAKFAADGKVLQGPAKKPLKTYTAKVEGNAILVKTV